MGLSHEEEKLLEEFMFEVFSAGFEAGYAGEVDLATAFRQYLEKTKNFSKEMRRQGVCF